MEKPKNPFGALDFTALEKRYLETMAQQRTQAKAAAHAGRYSVGPDAFLKGARIHGIVHDEVLVDFKTAFDQFDIATAKHKLSTEEWRWAVALRRVYNVNASYFEERKPKERAEIIKKLTELAKKNGRAGEKAAEAVAVVFEMAMDRKEPETQPTMIDIETHMDSFRYLFEHMIGGSK